MRRRKIWHVNGRNVVKKNRRGLLFCWILISSMFLSCTGCNQSTYYDNQEGDFTRYTFVYTLLKGEMIPIDIFLNQRKCEVEIGSPFIESLQIANRGKYAITLYSLSIDIEILKLNEGEWELLEESFSEKYGIYSTEGIYFFEGLDRIAVEGSGICTIRGQAEPWEYETCLRNSYKIQPGEMILLQYAFIFDKPGHWKLRYSIEGEIIEREIISRYTTVR